MGTGEILTIIGGTLTTAIGWAFGRKSERSKIKKLDAESDSITVASTEKAVMIWEGLNQQLSRELEIMRREMGEIKAQNIQLHKENVELKEQVRVLSERVEELEELKK